MCIPIIYIYIHLSYNHAVHVIRLRIHLLQTKLQTAELRARSSSLYLCPGYTTKACNGKYTESEAQQVVDYESGLFLCRECCRAYSNHPAPPGKKEYTLLLLDNTYEINKAMNDMRRVRVQLGSKTTSILVGDGGRGEDDGQGQATTTTTRLLLRHGIFDLLQKLRSSTSNNNNNNNSNSNNNAKEGGGGGRGGRSIPHGEPITSNLPSENMAMGIGSKRIAGTGRTAGILLKKQQKQGIVDLSHGGGITAAAAVGGGGIRNNYDELTYLKNAIGQEIAFQLEKGGGARAHLLATKGHVRSNLIDTAAMKVGLDIGCVARLVCTEREVRNKRRREEEKQQHQQHQQQEHDEMKNDGVGATSTKTTNKLTNKKKKKKLKSSGEELHFLQDNLGFDNIAPSKKYYNEPTSDNDDDQETAYYQVVVKDSYYVSDETDEYRNLPEDERKVKFQSQYKSEVERQKNILGYNDEDVEGIAWEDCYSVSLI